MLPKNAYLNVRMTQVLFVQPSNVAICRLRALSTLTIDGTVGGGVVMTILSAGADSTVEYFGCCVFHSGNWKG